MTARTIVSAGGTLRRTLHVYCEAGDASVRVARCRSCPNANVVTPHRVDCALAASLDTSKVTSCSSVAARLPARVALRPWVLCVRPEVALAHLHGLVPAPLIHVPVVDWRGSLVGVVLDAREKLREHRASRDLRVSDVSSPFPAYVEEGSSLLDAFSLMAARRLRQLPVVTRSMEVVGVLHDLDAMRAVTARRVVRDCDARTPLPLANVG